MALCWTVPHCIIWNRREKKITAVDISSSLLECTYKELNPLMYSLITFFIFFGIMLDTQGGTRSFFRKQPACMSMGAELMNHFLICSAQWCIGEIGYTMCADLWTRWTGVELPRVEVQTLTRTLCSWSFVF